MRNKAPLALMEQLVMLVVFALAAALCLQVFVLSDRMSAHGQDRDHGVVAVQNAAETLKLCGGDLDDCASLLGGTVTDGVWTLGYDEQWNSVSGAGAAYVLTAVPRAELPLLGSAYVSVENVNGDTLFGVEVCWQEVTYE